MKTVFLSVSGASAHPAGNFGLWGTLECGVHFIGLSVNNDQQKHVLCCVEARVG